MSLGPRDKQAQGRNSEDAERKYLKTNLVLEIKEYQVEAEKKIYTCGQLFRPML